MIAEVFGSTAAEKEDCLVVIDLDLVEGEVSRQTVSRSFDICIPSRFEVVHHKMKAARGRCGHNRLPVLFLKAVDGVKSFVRFARITGDHEYLRHGSITLWKLYFAVPVHLGVAALPA